MATVAPDTGSIAPADDALTINETPGVCGGYPCVGDTRIAVRLLVEAFERTRDEGKVAAVFPQLSRAQVDAALRYYRDNPARVDEDIERNPRTLASHRAG